jgi:hypothetical protein
MSNKPPPTHPNSFEHSENYWSFVGYFLLYGAAGAIIGRTIDYIVSSLDNSKTDRLTSFWLVVLQLLINGSLFYLFFQFLLLKRGGNELTFDDWVSSTFQGLIFITTMYSVQDHISKNVRQALY